MPDNEKLISDLVDRQDVCFLGFINEAGFPNIRAMLNPRKRQGLKEFYLTTNAASKKVQAFNLNSKACLYFYDRTYYHGVAFEGNIEVLHDQEIKDEVWRDMDTIFYESNTDPDYCVLKFTATKARYYSDYASTDIEL